VYDIIKIPFDFWINFNSAILVSKFFYLEYLIIDLLFQAILFIRIPLWIFEDYPLTFIF
jgi:hypothetical protein